MNVSILGQNIKKIRESKGISAYKLRNMAGIGAATISEIESGVRQSLNTNTVEKIANALEVPTDLLFAAEDNKEYVVSDIYQTMKFILTSEELTLDDEIMTEKEKKQFLDSISSSLELIRNQRNSCKESSCITEE